MAAVAKTSPFVRPDPRAIEASPWLKENDQHLDDGALLPTWDPGTNITIVRMVQVNTGMMLETARLTPGSHLAILPAWWSPGTGLRGRGAAATFVAEDTGKKQFDISMVLPGEQLRGSVQIKTSLLLLERPMRAAADPLAASRPGSILWHDECSIILEGDAPRFPMTAINFTENALGDAKTCWLLEWSPRDLEAPAMSCLRLWINKEHEYFYHAMVAPTPEPEQLAIRSALRFAVAEEMLQVALNNAQELAQGDFDYGSSGKVFLDLIEQLFPGMDPPTVRQLRQTDSGAFSAKVQSGTLLFSDLAAAR